MKPDGVAMEPTEAIGAEPSQPVTSVVVMEEEVPPQVGSLPTQPEEQATAPPAPKEGNGKAAETKDKPKGVIKAQPSTSVSASTKTTSQTRPGTRPGAAQSRVTNGARPSTNDPTKKTALDKKRTTTTTNTGASSASAGRRPVGGATAAASSVKTQTKVADRRHVGVPWTNSATAATNGTKTTTTGNGTISKRPMTGPVNGTKPKTTAPRPTSAPKPSTSVAKPDRTTVPKATRPASQPPTSRPATSRPPGNPTTARPAAHRLGATAPPVGRTTVAQPSKPTTVKKDVTRPPTNKPVASATNKATKPDVPKPTTATRSDTVSKQSAPSKTADLKTARPQATWKPPANARPPHTRQPLGWTPPASPIPKPASSSTTQGIKRSSKPTQSVVPFSITKKPHVSRASAAAPVAATAAVATVVFATSTEPEVAAQAEGEEVSPDVPSAPVPTLISVSPPSPSPVEVTPPGYNNTPAEDLSSHPHSPIISTASLQQDPVLAAGPLSPEQEPMPTAAVATLLESEEPALLIPEVSESSSPAALGASTPQGDGLFKAEANLNEDDDDEEEREGSQQVSVSDMSGTQPTEESRPDSAGPAGGSAWRGGGALLSELDSEDVSCSQQGASELSAPGVLEGTESMDDLGDASLKGAIVDMEGASAGSPDFEKVPDIPSNDFEEDEDEDDDDRVCDMEVGSERAEDPRRVRHDDDDDDDDEEEDEDVEMASEGVTESGLESYGNADEDDFAEDEKLDNLNRAALLHPAPLLQSAAQWDQPNNPWAQSFQPAENASAPLLAPTSPSVDAWQADSETPTQSPAQTWLELGSAPFVPQEPAVHMPSVSDTKLSHAQGLDEEHQPGQCPMQTLAPAPISGPGMSQSSTLSGADLAAHSSSETSTPEELRNYNKEGKLHGGQAPALVLSLQPDPEDQDLGIHLERGDGEEEEAETLPADEVLGGPATAPTSNPSSSSTSEDEASDTEGEAQLDEPLEDGGIVNAAFEAKPATIQHCLSALEEGEEAIAEEWASDAPHSANSAASYGFDMTTTASSSNAHSTGESCAKSPGIFSLEELPEEDKAPSLIGELTSLQQASSGEPPVDLLPLGGDGGGSDEQHYMLCGKQGAELGEFGELGGSLDPSLSLGARHPEPGPDAQPPYYSTICEKTENSLAGLNALPHKHRRDPAAPKSHCDVVTPPRLTCADLPPRVPSRQASPQLRRLEQHQQQLLELQKRRERQSKPKEGEDEEEEGRKKQQEEEERRRREGEELRQREELDKQRKELQLQLQQQQQELKQRQQIMQWQQELEQQQPAAAAGVQKSQSAVLLSPSSGLCTIYEALENSEEEEDEDDDHVVKELDLSMENSDLTVKEGEGQQESGTFNEEQEDTDPSVSSSCQTSPPPDSPPQVETRHPSQGTDTPEGESPPPSESPEQPPSLDLDWGKKVDIVQQLINQTLLLDGCSSLLLLPGGGGGTLSPLESSLWPNLLPPLTPPSATITSVSSFSPEAPGSSPQGEWTVVELETHH